ncbi:MAG TPA: hypothetical protein VNL73_11465 [Verrucomicrobiae bacterium]|nr:hypothetical protein [Verrucomicrobiae bacterium]
MVGIMELWAAILVSTVLVFLASWMVHMLPLWHRNDFPPVPNEDKVRDAMRPLAIPPGEYMIPRCNDPKQMKDPAFMEKLKQGPVVFLTVYPNEVFKMGPSLVQWFIYCIVVGIFAAYVAGRALEPGAEYLEVFRFAGFTAFCCYAVGTWPASIWFKRSWGYTAKMTLDGLIYGLLTGGTFGWLWPSGM